ncbi:MAG: Radical domain protein [Geobacteraceae bacterium]|nr:Radical domain protein [Geobacteraceae bacterium]
MKVLLTTLHAKYVHSSLALPYLAAACHGTDGIEIAVREFTINEQHEHLLRNIAAERADIVAFSCYIWNIEQTMKLASDLKKVQPSSRVILGGPEVSYTPEEILRDNEAIDCIIRGEGEEIFRLLITGLRQTGNFENTIKSISSGIAFRNGSAIVVQPAGKPVVELDSIPSPFTAGLVAMDKPLVYYETSRGCPFSCAFCMSSLEDGVRSFSMERIRQDLLCLIEHQSPTVKLVDRTFNYDGKRANEIWDFIVTRNRECRFHFEIAADLLSEENIRILEKVPDGMFRFEIGVQSIDSGTLDTVGRKTDFTRLYANVEQLLTRTGVTIHLDLIAGLPLEDYKGFLDSLQRLLELRPHHIQVEPLKVLKGTPMREIALQNGYSFSSYPPYKLLASRHLSFLDISSIESISRLLDIYFNSGKFRTVLEAVGNQEKLSDFFHSMSLFIEKQTETFALSQRSHFERFWSFASGRYEAEVTELLADALCYDFCLCEYPSAANIPSFMRTDKGGVGATKTAISMKQIAETVMVEKGSKVRTFVHRFRRDYTQFPPGDKKTEIAFIHISSQGKGLRIKPVPLG